MAKKSIFLGVKKLNYVKWVDDIKVTMRPTSFFVNIATTRLNRPRGGFSENFYADLIINRLLKTKG